MCCHKNALCKSPERFIDEIGIEMISRVNCLMFTMWDNTAQGPIQSYSTWTFYIGQRRVTFLLYLPKELLQQLIPHKNVRYCNCSSADAILFCLHLSIKLHTCIQCCFTDFIYGTSHQKCPFYFIIRLWPYSYYAHTHILNNARTLPYYTRGRTHPVLHRSCTRMQ